MAMRLRNCADPEWQSHCWMKQKQANRSWGICLGMQLLFDKSYEYGEHQGLGLIPGVMADLKEDIRKPKSAALGWNSLHLTEKGKKHPLFKYSKEGDYVYFVHSFYGKDCDESLLATSETAFRSRRPRQ